MSERERELFEAWATKNVCSPVRKYDNGNYLDHDVQWCWAAWQAALQGRVVMLLKKPQPAEDPDEWVPQDLVPPRRGKDQFRYVRKDGLAYPWTYCYCDMQFPHGEWVCGERLEVRCRRRDLPKVEQDEQVEKSEDPDEWVIQDRVIPRNHVDQWKWVGHDERANDVHWSSMQGNFTRYKHGDEAHSETLHVRCRRRDLPKEPEQCSVGCHGLRCTNPALPGKDHCSECGDEPEPQKTRVRLWVSGGELEIRDSDGYIIAVDSEVKHDADGFYVEDQSRCTQQGTN